MVEVYTFLDKCEERNLLGNKGANLVSMTRLGLPVPPGFIVSIDAYRQYKSNGAIPDSEIELAIAELERETKQQLGVGLEVSVRSSGPVSMPGMMDTLLNIDNMAQVKAAIKQVFDSWESPRAVEYRRVRRISA